MFKGVFGEEGRNHTRSSRKKKMKSEDDSAKKQRYIKDGTILEILTGKRYDFHKSPDKTLDEIFTSTPYHIG